MSTLIKRLQKKQEGITGLETAIILIAFVIVASVFAFVVLSAGLFSSQKAKEAVNTGVVSTMATMQGGVVQEMMLMVGLPAAGSPVDFTPVSANLSTMIISYMDGENMIPSLNWTIAKLSTINSDDILDPTELFQVSVIMPNSANLSIGPYKRFSLEIKPPDGPVLVVERTIPARITQYVNLH